MVCRRSKQRQNNESHAWQLNEIHTITRTQSEPADLRQRHVVRQVAAPYSVWQRFPLCPIEGNVNENFTVIKNPGFLPDHPKIEPLVAFAIPDIPRKFQKNLSITFWVILLTHRQTDKQTDKQTKTSKNITSLAEVKSPHSHCSRN